MAKHFVEGAIVSPIVVAAIPGAMAVNIVKEVANEIKGFTMEELTKLREKFQGKSESKTLKM